MEYLSLQEAIENIHRFQPEAIFLTQTSATPFGWAIKEAYKIAYPKEKCPKMFTIDVHNEKMDIQHNKHKSLFWVTDKGKNNAKKQLEEMPEFQNKVEEVKTKLQKHTLQDKILIFDETGYPDGRDNYYYYRTRCYAVLVLETAVEQLRGCQRQIECIGVGDFSKGIPYGIPENRGPWVRAKNQDFVSGQIWLDQYVRAKTDEEKANARQTIQQMKDIGKIVGERIKYKTSV